MTNIIFSRKEFEKHMKTTKEIQEKITLFGTPLESISQENIEIEVLSNRPDLISLEGFMRSFKKFLGKEPGLKKYSINKPEKEYKVYVDKSVKEMRPYVSCAIIKNISLNEEKLKVILSKGYIPMAIFFLFLIIFKVSFFCKFIFSFSFSSFRFIFFIIAHDT